MIEDERVTRQQNIDETKRFHLQARKEHQGVILALVTESHIQSDSRYMYGWRQHLPSNASVGTRKDAVEVLDFAKRGIVRSHHQLKKMEDLTQVFEDMRQGNGHVQDIGQPSSRICHALTDYA
jgi:D-arabinose 1-dehydrogenase-like Zn-dependent alcohol dehydrogenase